MSDTLSTVRAAATVLPAELPIASPSALVDRKALGAALGIVTRVADRRASIPVLANVRVSGDGDRLTLTTTDLDIEARVSVPAAADADLCTTVPAHLLADLVKKAPACDHVAVDAVREGAPDTAGPTGQGEAVVGFDGVTYRLHSRPAAGFPAMSTHSLDGHDGDAVPRAAFDLDCATLWDALDSVAFAISTEETRYYLNGVYMHAPDAARFGDVPTLTMVATDGHRLARRKVLIPDGAAGMPGIIVPRATVALVMRLLKAAGSGKSRAHPCDTVRVELTDAKVRFAWRAGDMDVVVTSRLIDGAFPDYQRVIPMANDKVLTVDRDALAKGVGAVALVSSDRGRGVLLSCRPDGACLTVNNPDAGSAQAPIGGAFDDNGCGDGTLNIGFNATYLATIADELGAGDVFVRMNDAGSPAIFNGARDDLDIVLMPMRV